MLKKIINAFKGKSATVNFNVLGVALLALDIFSGLDIIKSNPDYSMIFVAVGNILLRLKTNKPLEDK